MSFVRKKSTEICFDTCKQFSDSSESIHQLANNPKINPSVRNAPPGHRTDDRSLITCVAWIPALSLFFRGEIFQRDYIGSETIIFIQSVRYESELSKKNKSVAIYS